MDIQFSRTNDAKYFSQELWTSLVFVIPLTFIIPLPLFLPQILFIPFYLSGLLHILKYFLFAVFLRFKTVDFRPYFGEYCSFSTSWFRLHDTSIEGHQSKCWPSRWWANINFFHVKHLRWRERNKESGWSRYCFFLDAPSVESYYWSNMKCLYFPR